MTPRWIIVTLLVSAALNFFLIGVGATVVVVGARAAKMHAAAAAQRPAAALRRAALALPAGPVRQGFVAAARQATAAEAQPLTQGRQLRDEAWTGLGSATPNVADIKAKLAQARALEIAARGRIEEALVDHAATLPQDQRAAIGGEMRPATPVRQPPPVR